MNENNWKEFSDDISNITNEENLEDLQNSLKSTINSISNSFNELIQIVENTVKDDEIKQDSLHLISKLKNEMSNVVDNAKEKITEVTNLKASEEE